MNRAASGNVKNLEPEMTDVGAATGERAPGAAAESVPGAAHRVARSTSRQPRGKPLLALLVGFALGYAASLWDSRRR
jgi:hypothetical protein